MITSARREITSRKKTVFPARAAFQNAIIANDCSLRNGADRPWDDLLLKPFRPGNDPTI